MRRVILILIILRNKKRVDEKRRKYLRRSTRKSHYFAVIKLYDRQHATTPNGKLVVGERMAPAPTGNLQLNANSLATGLPLAGGHFEVSGYHRLQVLPYNMVNGSCVITVTLLRYTSQNIMRVFFNVCGCLGATGSGKTEIHHCNILRKLTIMVMHLLPH